MLSSLQGIVQEVHTQFIVLNVSGIGFGIAVPDNSNFIVGHNKKLYTHLHWNQEQGPTLFGFSTEAELITFKLIIQAPGIGPKIALAMLAELGVQRFINAIIKEDEQDLTSVSGIGNKKAEQIIVQLKHKVSKLVTEGSLNLSDQQQIAWKEVHEVLTSLHYSKQEISAAMNYLSNDVQPHDQPIDQIIRKALSFLAKQKNP